MVTKDKAELLRDVVEVARVRALAASGEARRIRERTGVSVRELARAIGTSAGSLSRWETGENTPRHAAALPWAHVLRELERLGNTLDGIERALEDAGEEMRS
jgi:transcriptional regulator with XRE-family HTH domain